MTFLSSLPSQHSGPPRTLILSLDTPAYLDTMLVLGDMLSLESLAATSQPNVAQKENVEILPGSLASEHELIPL